VCVRVRVHVSFLRQVEIVEWNDTGAAYEKCSPRCVSNVIVCQVIVCQV